MSASSSNHKRPSGVYVPPAKRVKQEKFDIGTEEYQRIQWDENKKKITGLINRANSTNITTIVKELFQCNLIRYKGLFATALMKAQEASPSYTDVYAALLAVINSRIRTLGILVTNRIILQYKTAFKNNNNSRCLALVRFIAHLTNQELVHELLAFQLINHLMNKPTPSSIEIVISFIKECGQKLEQLNSVYLFETFRTLRELSLDNDLDSRTHDLIDLLHDLRKEKFRDFPPIRSGLDLVDEKDKITHTIELNGPRSEDFQTDSNYFKYDKYWTDTEAKYEDFKRSLLGENDESDGSDDYSDAEGSSENEEEEEQDAKPEKDVKPDQKVIDATGSDLIKFRRDVYLTFRSSVRHEEVVHKLLKSKIDPQLYDELCQMIIDCCGQERTYESIYGLVASKLCQLKKRDFAPKFEIIFEMFYETVHRFENNKIRNVAKFYAHLLTTDSIDWACLKCLKLRDNATSSAGRCFIKLLFDELVSILSLRTLIEYTKEPSREAGFKNLFPLDEEKDMHFAANFFIFSGLPQLAEPMRTELEARKE